MTRSPIELFWTAKKIDILGKFDPQTIANLRRCISWVHFAKIHILEVIWTWVPERLKHLKRPIDIVLSRQWLTREAREPTKCKVTAWKRGIY